MQVEGRGIRLRCTKCINVASFANCIKPALCYEVYGSPKHVMIARCERSHSIYFYPAISRQIRFYLRGHLLKFRSRLTGQYVTVHFGWMHQPFATARRFSTIIHTSNGPAQFITNLR